MAAERFFETLVSYCNTTQQHNPDLDLNLPHSENMKFHKGTPTFLAEIIPKA
jgi:hypothetical protein